MPTWFQEVIRLDMADPVPLTRAPRLRPPTWGRGVPLGVGVGGLLPRRYRFDKRFPDVLARRLLDAPEAVVVKIPHGLGISDLKRPLGMCDNGRRIVIQSASQGTSSLPSLWPRCVRPVVVFKSRSRVRTAAGVIVRVP